MAEPPRVPLRLPADNGAPPPDEEALRAIGLVLSQELDANSDLRERVLRVRRRIHPKAQLCVEREPANIVLEVACKFSRLREPINRHARTKRARNARLDVLEPGQTSVHVGFNGLLTVPVRESIDATHRGELPLQEGRNCAEFVLGSRVDFAKCEVTYCVLIVEPRHLQYIEIRHHPLRWIPIVPDMTVEERLAFSRTFGVEQ